MDTFRLGGEGGITPEGAKVNTWRPKETETTAGEDRVRNPVIGIPTKEFADVDLAALECEMESVLYA